MAHGGVQERTGFLKNKHSVLGLCKAPGVKQIKRWKRRRVLIKKPQNRRISENTVDIISLFKL